MVKHCRVDETFQPTQCSATLAVEVLSLAQVAHGRVLFAFVGESHSHGVGDARVPVLEFAVCRRFVCNWCWCVALVSDVHLSLPAYNTWGGYGVGVDTVCSIPSTSYSSRDSCAAASVPSCPSRKLQAFDPRAQMCSPSSTMGERKGSLFARPRGR